MIRAVAGWLLLSLGSVVLHAQETGPEAQKAREEKAAFALAEEAVRLIEARCYYGLSSPVILAGLLKTPAAGGEQAGGVDIATLPENEAWAAARQLWLARVDAPGQRLGLRQLIEACLASYCSSIDPWSRYVTSEDVSRIEKMSTAGASGVGMTLFSKDGSIYCYPFPDSPASLVGIQPGDKLISVGGAAVAGKPLEILATMIKGPAGSQVMLRIEKGVGRSQLIQVTREAANAPTLMVEKDISGITIRIRRFDTTVPTEIRAALEGVSPTKIITLDLRGCQGGSMLSALETARLFLNQDLPLITLVERGNTPQEFRTEAGATFQPSNLTLLQDEGSASAAEILIATLVGNAPGRVASSGAKSYGKGVVQESLNLSSGGRMDLTTGILFGPSGRSWNGVGLLPSTGNQAGIYPEAAPSITGAATRPKTTIKLVE